MRVLEIPQLVAPGQVEARTRCRVFTIQPPSPEPRAPNPYIVGFMARDYGAATPGRLISSAKSWLCHSGRRSHGGAAALARGQRCRADFAGRGEQPLSGPHSRGLERRIQERAAGAAGCRADAAGFVRRNRPRADGGSGRPGRAAKVVLIEEPQAAFYAWIYKHQDNWERLFRRAEDPGLRHRRRHDRLHADPRPPRRPTARCNFIASRSAIICSSAATTWIGARTAFGGD